MTLQELKAEANRLKEEQKFQQALPHYVQIWDVEKNEWNGYRLAQCHRKIGNFDEAKIIYKYFDTTFPSFIPIRNERLWLIYSEKIKDRDNENLLEDAKSLIALTDQYDKYTGSIYIKTVIRVVRHLLYVAFENELAYEWLSKLDQSVINNTVFKFNGQTYPADRKVYFILFADVLIKLDKHVDYLDSCLTSLNFDGIKHTQFKKHIIESTTFEDYVSRVRVALYLKYFQEEIHLRQKQDFRTIYNQQKTTLINDLSHFLFCPVSFAINETFQIEANTTWEKDEWLREKMFLIDRHKIFQKSKSINDCFSDTDITIDAKLESDFRTILESKIMVNNATNPNPTIYFNESKTLKGTPDYILQNAKSEKFAVTEKFTGIKSADSNTPFESDLVKHYAFLEELKALNLKFGYFLTWYWQLTNIDTNNGQVKKKIVVTSYRLTKIESNPENLRKLKRTIDSVNTFKSTKKMEIDGNQISYANKCLNCSVISYCNHKTGKFNQINLPYDFSALHLKNKPSISIKPNTDSRADDLPF